MNPAKEIQQLDELVQAVRESAKYRAVSAEAVANIGRRELAARRNLKEALKATRNKLHQVAGAYLDARPRYNEWLAQLQESAGDATRMRATCQKLMAAHASTRERLPMLDRFYATLVSALGPVGSVLDLACGLNPLALPWMPLAPDACYYACDLYEDLAAFMNAFLPLAGVRGRAWACDLISTPPRERADLALALKLLPVLEQRDKHAGAALLRAIDAPAIIVSFPLASLGGHNKGMAANYAARFEALAAVEHWGLQRLEFPGELAYLVRK